MSFELIQATEADKPFLLALRKLTMVEHLEKAGLYLSDDEHAFRLNDDYECSYLIVCRGDKVGILKYRELEDKIQIIQLQVHPQSQGKGLGKQVMERVLGWSKERQKRIELSVLKASPARILYQRLGFSVSGEDEHEFHMEYIQ
jgi:GNAT superfamily N-acetyltransferase